MLLSTMSRSCTGSPAHLTIPRHGWTHKWWIDCWKSVTGLRKGWGARQVPRLSCTIYRVMRACEPPGLRLPRSTRTIHRLLREHGRIAPRLPHASEPTERPQPMQQWQLDYKDASTVPADPQGKQQHVVETLNIIDKGTSVLIASHVRSDFTAETARHSVALTFQEQGLPASITLDRDPRWVGAPQGSDFPAALIRLCHCLGVAVVVCDPHHPQQNDLVAYCTPSA